MKNILYVEVLDTVINLIKEKRKNNINTLSIDSLTKEEDIHDFFKKNKNLNTKINLIISSNQIIIKNAVVQKMSKKDLDNYIKNNITDYFSVNKDKFQYTYKIVNTIKNDMKSFYNLIIFAVPKELILDIKNLEKTYKLKYNKIDLYPYLLYKSFNNNNNTAIIDLSLDRMDFISLSKGNLFMYTNDRLKSFDNNYDDIIEEIKLNIGGYLNFFTNKHSGEKIQDIYLISSSVDYKILEDLKRVIGNEYNVIVKENKCNKINRFSVLKSIEKYKDKKIKNFILKENNNKKINSIIILLSLIGLLIISLMSYPFIYGKILNNKIDSLSEENNSYNIQQSLLQQKEDIEKTINTKKDILNKVKSMQIDYLKIINIIENNIPNSVKMDSIVITTDFKTTIIFSVTTTKDAGNLIKSIKNLDIFENIPINSINLNDKEQKMSFDLKIKSNKEKDFILDKKW